MSKANAYHWSTERGYLKMQWHPTKNEGLDIETLSNNAINTVWWLCACGHEWRTQFRTRASKNLEDKGCGACSGNKKIFTHPHGTLMLEIRPELIDEWDFIKNIGIDPYKLTYGSCQKVWWICSNCNHPYQASPNRRCGIQKFGKDKDKIKVGTNCPQKCRIADRMKSLSELSAIKHLIETADLEICNMKPYIKQVVVRILVGPDKNVLLPVLLEHLSYRSERAQYVVKHRISLDGYRFATFIEIGERLGTTRSRAQQIEVDFYNKLQRNAQFVDLINSLTWYQKPDFVELTRSATIQQIQEQIIQVKPIYEEYKKFAKDWQAKTEELSSMPEAPSFKEDATIANIPLLAKMWDSEMNAGKDPTKIMAQDCWDVFWWKSPDGDRFQSRPWGAISKYYKPAVI